MGVGVVTDPNSYFTAVVSATGADVESATTVVSAWTAVESVVSVAVDPEPHAVSVSATPSAKINVYFFI